MSCVSSSRRWTVGLVLALLTFAPLFAAPAGPEKKELSPAEKLRKDLDQTISVDLVDQPLNLVFNQLREATKINFVLDQQTLGQMGINLEMPVNGKFKDAKLRTVLRTVLGGLNLSYAIVGDVIFISNDDMTMYRQLQQRVSVDVDKVEFSQAMRRLSRETGTNLIVDSRVAKEANLPVTFQADDVPLETVVRLMAEMVGLKPVRIGNVLFIASKAHAQELRSDPDLINRTPVPQPGAPQVDMGIRQPQVLPPAVIPAAPGMGEEKPADPNTPPPPPPPAKPEVEKKEPEKPGKEKDPAQP